MLRLEYDGARALLVVAACACPSGAIHVQLSLVFFKRALRHLDLRGGATAGGETGSEPVAALWSSSDASRACIFRIALRATHHTRREQRVMQRVVRFRPRSLLKPKRGDSRLDGSQL